MYLLKNAIYFEIIYLNPKSPYSLVNNYFIVSTFCMFSLHLLHSFSTSYLESRYHLNVLITEMYIEQIHQMFNANYWLRSVIIVCPWIHMSTSCFRDRPIVVQMKTKKNTDMPGIHLSILSFCLNLFNSSTAHLLAYVLTRPL